ncbi:MAG: hypothetical protein R6X25_12300 [Candidatus Krumholzibacteriia bacterium]
MADTHDIERLLREFRYEADPSRKEALLGAFAAVRHESQPPRRSRVWARPIPLYAAAAVLVAMVGLSFFAGQRVAALDRQRAVAEPHAPAADADAPHSIPWSTAASDLL